MVGATLVPLSQNAKLGPVAATYVAQVTCPTSCPFYKNGCYAETGNAGIHTARLNRTTADAMELAQAEADLIHAAAINPKQSKIPLRLHVVGDCKTDAAAGLVSTAAAIYQKRKGTVWTYTHAWKDVRRESWGDVSVLASCETVADVRKAMSEGYAAAIVRDQDTTIKEDGLTYVPCPQQRREGVTCASCRLCMQDSKLRDRGVVIVFTPHGFNRKKVNQTLESINLLELARSR